MNLLFTYPHCTPRKSPHPAGFEPARGNPIGFQVQRLNHSATNAHSFSPNSLQRRTHSRWAALVQAQTSQHQWLDGLGVWFALRVREVPGSNPGQAQPSSFSFSVFDFFYFFSYFLYLLKVGLNQSEERGPPFFIQWVIKCCLAGQSASIAQWQSTGLVNQGSRVQSSLEA